MKKKLNIFNIGVYDNSTGWKINAEGKIETKDGNPIYVGADGKEMVLESGTVSRLNAEAKSHREAKEDALKKLRDFEGLDAAKAREALNIVSKLDQKQLIDAGKVDEVKQQITSQFTEKLNEKDKAITTLQQKYDASLVDKLFDGSDFVRNNISVPIGMFRDSFSKHFKVENGKVNAFDPSGNMLMSKERVGEYATGEEALRLLVDMHPQKDMILKADIGSGSGSNGGGGNRPGSNIIKRADFDRLEPVKRAEISQKVSKKEMILTD